MAGNHGPEPLDRGPGQAHPGIPPFGNRVQEVWKMPERPIPLPCEPLLLCEACGDNLTSQVFPGAYTLSGQEEACCEACWPELVRLLEDGKLRPRRREEHQ